MYVPKTFDPPDLASVESYVRKYNFATLTGCQKNIPVSVHIPLILDEKLENLYGHVAKENVIKNNFDGHSTMLATFMNTHAYISSSWYDHVNVPTWNYIAIHLYGIAHPLEGRELYDSISSLVEMYEEGRRNRFHMKDMSEDMLQAHMDGLVGFRMEITKVEAAFKLSQNRNDRDYKEIIEQLEKSDDLLSHNLAGEMKNLRKI